MTDLGLVSLFGLAAKGPMRILGLVRHLGVDLQGYKNKSEHLYGSTESISRIKKGRIHLLHLAAERNFGALATGLDFWECVVKTAWSNETCHLVFIVYTTYAY